MNLKPNTEFTTALQKTLEFTALQKTLEFKQMRASSPLLVTSR